MAQVNFGPEYDNRIIRAVKAALRESGATRRAMTWGVGGSQEIATEEWTLGGQLLTLTGETYFGLTLDGPPLLVEQIAQRARAVLTKT